MIFRNGTVAPADDPEDRASEHGAFTTLKLSDAGGISAFGAYVEVLEPGSRSSDRHWHETEDEFLYVLEGQVTIIENDGQHVLSPGDCACWPAGVDNAHCVINRSASPCSYLIVGDRPAEDVCHYPDIGRQLHTEVDRWRITDDSGTVLKSGKL